MTDEELAARKAALAARPGARSGRRRPHAAGASRILAAGFSAAALFGLVAAFDLSSPGASASTVTPAPPVQTPITTAAPARRIVVIIHRPAPAANVTPSSPGGSSGTSPGGSSGASPVSTAARSSAAPGPSAAPSPAPSPRPAPVTTTQPS